MALISVTISGNAAPLKKSVDESEGLLGRLGGSFTKIGIAAAAGFGAAAAAIGVAAKAAADDEKSYKQLETTIRNVTGATYDQIKAVDDQIGKMSIATGVADDKLRPAFEALVRGTRDISVAQEQMGLVLDISTALQMDATTVADALAKAQQGNTKALKALSPEMAAMIKDGADMGTILDTLKGNFEGASEAAANTFGGRLQRLKVFASELVEQIGYYLLPVLSKIAEFIINDVVPAFQRIVEKYGPMLADVFQKIADFIGEKVVPVMRDKLIPFIQRVAEFIGEKLVPVIRDVAIKVFEGLRDIFEKVTEKIQDNQDNIRKITDFFRTLVDFVVQKVAPVLGVVLSKAFDVVGAAIGPVIDVVFDLMGVFADLGKFILKIAGFVLDVIEGMVNGVIDGINLLIRVLNKIPGINIGEIGNVSFTLPNLGNAPTAPSATGTSGPDAVERRLAAMTPSGFDFSFGGTDGGGGGGGGGGGSKKPQKPTPVDMTGQVTIFGGTDISGGGGGGFGAIMDTMAFLDGLTGGAPTVVNNVTVNTVTADANLPNLIVDALQQYNITSGPIDVAIAA